MVLLGSAGRSIEEEAGSSKKVCLGKREIGRFLYLRSPMKVRRRHEQSHRNEIHLKKIIDYTQSKSERGSKGELPGFFLIFIQKREGQISMSQRGVSTERTKTQKGPRRALAIAALRKPERPP